jgi:hypothetical protein
VRQLIDAFRAAAVPDSTLAIHGDPDLVEEYGAQVREAAAGDPCVSLEGPYASGDAYRILAGIDVLVVPSLWDENAPLVLLTALASGTPVVASNAQGILEFLQPGKDGLVYPMGDNDALAACLARFGSEPDLLEELAASQKPYAFSGLDCARATLDVYREAGAGWRPARFSHPSDRVEPTLRSLDEAHAPDCWEGDVLGVLGRAAARRMEVWVPRAAATRGGPPAADGRRPPPTVRNVLRRAVALHGGLRLGYHSRPYFSLWAFDRPGHLDLARVPGFAESAELQIVARHNRGSRSLLRYRIEGEEPGERHEFQLVWPKKRWSRLSVPLRTCQGRRVASLEWIPTVSDGRSPLKLDLLDIRLVRDDSA